MPTMPTLGAGGQGGGLRWPVSVAEAASSGFSKRPISRDKAGRDRRGHGVNVVSASGVCTSLRGREQQHAQRVIQTRERRF